MFRQISSYSNNLHYLLGAMQVLNLRLHRQLLRWRGSHHGQATPEELGGLYMSDTEADAVLDSLYTAQSTPGQEDLNATSLAELNNILEQAERRHNTLIQASQAAGVVLHLPELAERLGLDDFARHVLLLALVSQIDRRYERLFAYLNDDLTRREPTVDLALQLFCSSLEERLERRRAFAQKSPLRSLHLLHMGPDTGRQPTVLLTAGFQLEERIVNYLLGQDVPDSSIDGLYQFQPALPDMPILVENSQVSARKLAGHLAGISRPAWVQITGPDSHSLCSLAAYLVQSIKPEAALMVVDTEELVRRPVPQDALGCLQREAYLHGAVLAFARAESLKQDNPALRTLLAPLAKDPLIFMSQNPLPGLHPPPGMEFHHIATSALDAEMRLKLWQATLGGELVEADLAELANRFRLSGNQILQAARQAKIQAALHTNGSARAGRQIPIQRNHLFAASRTQSAGPLDHLAQHIASPHTWEDLILPQPIKDQIRSLEHWVRFHHVVYSEWGYARRALLNRGLAVLFCGPSGTGKTMAAGILARSLELDVYKIDLSSVVSKYIGETEKNLSQIFSAAESANAILLFDEADALFGRRSEVKDAHDRYANIEVSYLLQRMEAYEGVAILATNFRQNIDHAFARRLHLLVDFPFPQAADRERIWQRLLPPEVPQAADVDLAFLADHFALSGGNIKNCAITAAFSAASEGTAVSMRHLILAVARELEKIDQPIIRSEFGTYYEYLRPFDYVNGHA